MRPTLALLLFIASFCFALGITLPIVHFQKLYFFNETPSLIGLFAGLWAQGSVAVALAVALFSIVFPALKLALVFIAAIAPQSQVARSPLLRFTATLSRWSLMDVLLVALVIFAAKSSGLADAAAQPGLWFYATSALTGALAAWVLKRDQQENLAR